MIWNVKKFLLFASNSENISIIWCLEKFVVLCKLLQVSNSLQVAVMFEKEKVNVKLEKDGFCFYNFFILQIIS